MYYLNRHICSGDIIIYICVQAISFGDECIGLKQASHFWSIAVIYIYISFSDECVGLKQTSQLWSIAVIFTCVQAISFDECIGL